MKILMTYILLQEFCQAKPPRAACACSGRDPAWVRSAARIEMDYVLQLTPKWLSGFH
jgi:hypothetical protein